MKASARVAAAATALSLAAGLSACGQENTSGGSDSDKRALTIGLLLPDHQAVRYEKFDKPLIEEKVRDRCRDCTLKYANARGDVATQAQQVDTMIANGVDVLLLDPLSSTALRSSVTNATEAGIPVIAYDRLVDGPVSAFVAYDRESIGKVQGETLLAALGDQAAARRIVWIEGPHITPGAREREEGALAVLKGKVKIGKRYEAAAWDAEDANTIMTRAIATLGAHNIDGVYAANDALAAGAVSALRAARIRPLPPVTGQDAELAAVQRIVAGDQYSSVYKPYEPQADAAADIAIRLGRGENIDGIAKDRTTSSTLKNIPSVLLHPIPLTAGNIKDTMVKEGVYTIDQICTAPLQAACEKAGLTR